MKDLISLYLNYLNEEVYNADKELLNYNKPVQNTSGVNVPKLQPMSGANKNILKTPNKKPDRGSFFRNVKMSNPQQNDKQVNDLMKSYPKETM